jgi:class 3 adenylate cyclase
MLGRLDEARILIVRPEPDKNLQLATEQSRIRCEYHLAGGDPRQAAEAARLVASQPQLLIRGWVFVDPIVQALIAGGDIALAEPIADAIRVHLQKTLPPQLLLVLARIELATSHAESALDLSRRSAKLFGDRGEVLEQLNAEIVAAQCLAVVDVESARTEALACIEAARRMHARWYESQALEVARSVGVEPPAEAGEKLVTSLHADIRGYTAITAARSPAELADLVSAFQRWAKQEIEQRHGQVDKFAGDAVIATFNLSGETVDHTRHALEAARAMSAKAALLDLPVGIGIAVGPAIVGPLEPGGTASVRGEAANLAKRLQAVAGPGEVVLSRSAFKRLSRLAAQPEALPLQGTEESEVVYRLQPERPRKARSAGDRPKL